ncbi:hypothetical protein DUI87_09142 [Hirundo rustica rustica]|uniref:CCHC-type domain-containing protein n=1 Tax=Hirundo rustica rustica TaxID=333673 RepID=A0A3M0KLU6_HIRRU|nr:hypothetical protein DUI87_09142 [Hirundo rustica rustica]
MVRDSGAAQEEQQDMSITDDDIIRITASEDIPVQTTKAFDFSHQASSFLLSKDFMKQFFWQFSEAASEFQQDSLSSFSRLFPLEKGTQVLWESFLPSYVLQLPGGPTLSFQDVAEKLRDAQQSLVSVPQAKEKETKQDDVKPQKQEDLGKDEAALKLQTQQSILVSDKTQEVLTDIKNAAQKAMVQIPPTGVTENIYTDIKQGPSESFTSFIDRLTQAVDRQISDDGVKPYLLWCLAFANANPECKRVISAMPGQPSMAEVIEACSKVGTPQHITTVLGDQVKKAIRDAFANFQQRQCYKCGKQGHFKKNCPKLAKIASSPDVCPR